jgi:hypothetical protein
MFIFGIRICATDPAFSTGVWLCDDTVKQSLVHHQVTLNISNSTCDSGRMVVAGVVLLKHPQYTHRLYYLLALRKQLPANTPYFDIGIHHRTSQAFRVLTWLFDAAKTTRRSSPKFYRIIHLY